MPQDQHPPAPEPDELLDDGPAEGVADADLATPAHPEWTPAADDVKVPKDGETLPKRE